MTDKGIGVGSSLAEVKKAYGNNNENGAESFYSYVSDYSKYIRIDFYFKNGVVEKYKIYFAEK